MINKHKYFEKNKLITIKKISLNIIRLIHMFHRRIFVDVKKSIVKGQKRMPEKKEKLSQHAKNLLVWKWSEGKSSWKWTNTNLWHSFVVFSRRSRRESI